MQMTQPNTTVCLFSDANRPMKSTKSNDAVGTKFDKIDWQPFETDTRETFIRISKKNLTSHCLYTH